MPSTSPAPNQRAFAALLRRPDAEIDLVRAALIVARDVYPDLDGTACIAQLDALAARVHTRLAAGAGHLPADLAEADPALRERYGAIEALRAINEVLFDEAGFHGNTDDYYDPRNSYLNEVLARRTGIPITLALVYIEVARRVGLPLHGVGLPGHFMVGYQPPATGNDPGAALFVDPFNGGELRTVAECVTLVQSAGLSNPPLLRRWLAPLTPRPFLARMLNNLKAIYLDRSDWPQALRIVDYLLLVQPQALDDLRLRGMLYYRLGAFMPALSDLKHYLHAAPDAADADQVRYYTRLLHNLLFAAN